MSVVDAMLAGHANQEACSVDAIATTTTTITTMIESTLMAVTTTAEAEAVEAVEAGAGVLVIANSAKRLISRTASSMHDPASVSG